MSNHVAGNWFVSIFKMVNMTRKQLEYLSTNKNYRYTTRRNAKQILRERSINYVY